MVGQRHFTNGSVQSITLQQNGVFQAGEDGFYNIGFQILRISSEMPRAARTYVMVFHDCSFEVDTVVPVLNQATWVRTIDFQQTAPQRYCRA